MSLQTHVYEDNTGFIRLDDDSIENGIIDIDSVEKLVIGTREALTYFLKAKDSDLAKGQVLNFPIQTREGCWEILIPALSNLGSTGGVYALGVTTGAAVKGVNAYVTRRSTLLAEKHHQEKDKQELYRQAFTNLQTVIKIAQHLNTTSSKKIPDLKHVDWNKRTALLVNDEGNVMSVTLDEIEIFHACPDKILRSIASVVTDGRTVSIGYQFNGATVQETIDIDSKEIFAPEDEPTEPVLPELKDGEYVRLVGYVRRGNQKTNTLGFEYGGHVITCEPDKKLITGYINQHYKKCELAGVVVRTSKAQVVEGKIDRPRIIFSELALIEDASLQQSSLLQNN